MKRRGRRLGALLLALVMVLSLVPMTALAARIDNSEIAIEAPDAVTPADTAELPIGAENAPAQLAEGETISPDTRYESWEHRFCWFQNKNRLSDEKFCGISGCRLQRQQL